MTNQPQVPAPLSETDEPDWTPETPDELPEDVKAYISSLEAALQSTEGCDYGGSSTVKLYGIKKDTAGVEHVVDIMVTSHARTPEGSLDGVIRAISHGKEKYHLNPWNPNEIQRPAGQPQPQPQRTQPQPPAGAIPPAGVPGAPAASQPAAATGGTFVTTKIEVKLRADGKVDVAFFGPPPNKYPAVTMVKTPEAAAKMFSDGTGLAWTAQHFSTTGPLAYTAKVTWVNSDKKNQAGNFYKNVVSITAP